MIENISANDLKEIYEEINSYPNKEQFVQEWNGTYAYRKVNLDFIVDFLRNIKCDGFIFSKDQEDIMFKKTFEKKLSFEEHPDFKKEYYEKIINGGQVIHLNPKRLEIISKHKRLDFDLEKALYASRDITITELTEEGLYYFKLKGYCTPDDKIAYKYDISFIPTQPGQEKKLLEVNLAEKNYVFLIHNDHRIATNITVSIEEQDLPKFVNKIYRTGLQNISEMIKNGGKLEITDEDRKKYELTGKEKEAIQNVQMSTQFEKKNDQILRENSNEQTNEIVDQLILLRSSGIELTEEQRVKIELHEKLNSEKFQQYKEHSQVRKEHQEEVRNKIAVENERKEKWHNSPENPTNKRIEELKKLKKQIQVLEQLSKIDDSLLSKEQRELLENGKIFFKMLNTNKSLEHEVDTGMNPEIRSWYQDYYSNEEEKSRK